MLEKILDFEWTKSWTQHSHMPLQQWRQTVYGPMLPSGWGKPLFPSAWHPRGHICSSTSSLGATNVRKRHWLTEGSPMEDHWDGQGVGAHDIWGHLTGWDTFNPREKQSLGEIWRLFFIISCVDTEGQEKAASPVLQYVKPPRGG